jgi:fumarylacetoacetase
MPVNETHDPRLRSWVQSANIPGCDFPIQNLPFGAFRRSPSAPGRVGVAIGDEILDLNLGAERGVFADAPTLVRNACRASSLNELMRLGPEVRAGLRSTISGWLRADAGAPSVHQHAIEPLLVSQSAVAMLLPADIGDYTDFYASVFHATNVGSMFRPDEPLLPNYKHVPIGYHGRSSSVVPSGAPVRRPVGQVKPEGASEPLVSASRRLDYELEVGVFIGPGNDLGDAIPIERAEQHVFGVCLLNDWSARDIQMWEYQPLGPFLAKSFATSISPWVVTLDALEPFRAPAFRRPDGDPAPLPYLDAEPVRVRGGIDLRLEVALSTARMREGRQAPQVISRSSLRHLYWTIGQMVAHHTSNGCNLRPGDLLGTGTVSGPTRESRGCLLELTWRGSEPLELPGGETRRFLEDGDEVVFRGYCERDGATRIGLGECRGQIVPAREAAW